MPFFAAILRKKSIQIASDVGRSESDLLSFVSCRGLGWMQFVVSTTLSAIGLKINLRENAAKLISFLRISLLSKSTSKRGGNGVKHRHLENKSDFLKKNYKLNLFVQHRFG